MNRKGRLTSWGGYLAGAGLLTTLCSTAALAGTLQGVDVTSLPGDRVEMKLSFDSAPPEIKGYSIEQPARIVLDLPGTESAVDKYNELGFSNARSVTVMETKDRTRLTVSMDSSSSYTTRTEGNNVYVLVGEGGPVSQAAPAVAAAITNQAAASTKNAFSSSNGLTSIDFERGDDGEGNIVIGLSSKKVLMDLEEQGGRLRLTFPNADLPVSLRNRLDVNDFATPVQFIDARVEDGKALVVIEPKGEFDYLAWQTDDKMTISVKELTSQQIEQKARKQLVYSGDKLSLNFQDIEVRDVLQILADFKDLNLVASDTVGGSVTLRLKSVPWDQALDIVLKSKGLGKRLENNVLVVAPAAELAAQERELLESQQQIIELAPLYTELVQVNYATAAEIAAVLLGGEGNRILSERGSVQVIDRTNSLLVQETQNKLDEIRDLVERVDIPVRQVQIEARIVTADTNFRKELGVKWGGAVQVGSGNNLKLGGQGSSWNPGDQPLGDGTSPGSGGEASFGNNNLFTDLSVTGTGSSALAIGLLTDSAVVNLEISALESDGGGEIVSQPRVITSDKQKATIKSGKEIPYQEASSSGATTTEFKEAVLSVEVTPQITPDGRVIMDIQVNNDSEGPATASGIPTINTNEVKTKVLIEDGQTVVLGGIFSKTETRGVEKVPLLGDLPGVGRLFRKDTKKDERNETLIFITPKILTATMALR
ncbi:type IV pilus secretin PilQ [Parendozoicomonas haliclonae]|uniref:Type IV pilus biogenesis and competence protein PilQ n=1 Tax=Parendozoicomonas haliclonae TaxID=1960125 RepID=A0A1X7AEY7_9GAMM|nr:type IV pilus secretin PilQ [Parendozoicomonas haliclonae]SMA35961.1 Type IV pilus biogenesis and competence protein PilQ precursor [Parendozoicomonas haliclonae]